MSKNDRREFLRMVGCFLGRRGHRRESKLSQPKAAFLFGSGCAGTELPHARMSKSMAGGLLLRMAWLGKEGRAHDWKEAFPKSCALCFRKGERFLQGQATGPKARPEACFCE
ncbi:MAG: hypothetical protein K6E71_07505, partial [Lachnospiraceae bacterium]|nr:hypothetical protein [Lachnospiraceae bacterium]